MADEEPTEFRYTMHYADQTFEVEEHILDQFAFWDGSPMRVEIDRDNDRTTIVYVTTGVPLRFEVRPKKERAGARVIGF